MVYLYAVTDAGLELTDEHGFDAAPLRAVVAGRVQAIVCDIPERPRTTEGALWEHEAVVEELMKAGAVLPVRFGSTLADDAQVEAMLHEREDELVAGLERVRGAVELGVRALWDSGQGSPSRESATEGEHDAREAGDDVSPAGEGTAYLLGRLERRRRSQELAARVHEPLAALAREATHKVPPAPQVLLTGAYLVEEGSLDAFRDLAEELDRALDGVAVLATGPWPPYSFAPAETARREVVG